MVFFALIFLSGLAFGGLLDERSDEITRRFWLFLRKIGCYCLKFVLVCRQLVVCFLALTNLVVFVITRILSVETKVNEQQENYFVYRVDQQIKSVIIDELVANHLFG